jgi:hypothetical protein
MSCRPKEARSIPPQGNDTYNVHHKVGSKDGMDYITTMEEVIDERRLDWLGNVARQTDKNSQRSSSQHGL